MKAPALTEDLASRADISDTGLVAEVICAALNTCSSVTFYEDPPHDISYGIPKCTDRLHAIEPPRLYAVATARGCRVVCFTLPTASVREPQVCSNVAAVTFCTKDPLRHRIEILIPSPGCSEQFVTC